MTSREDISFARYAAIGLTLVALQAVVLRTLGRPLICTCGEVRLWYGDLFGSGLSQHLSDWYSFTHITHGFVFYAVLKIAAPRASVGLRLVMAMGLEVSWEVAENSPLVIDRYRQTALAQGYVGDSVVNSLSDTCFAVLGFMLASVLPVRLSVAIVLINEAALAYLIHDNLLLNIVQLAHPTKSLSDWQASGGVVGAGHLQSSH
jgi:Protein of unknown function (DUF2585)